MSIASFVDTCWALNILTTEWEPHFLDGEVDVFHVLSQISDGNSLLDQRIHKLSVIIQSEYNILFIIVDGELNNLVEYRHIVSCHLCLTNRSQSSSWLYKYLDLRISYVTGKISNLNNFKLTFTLTHRFFVLILQSFLIKFVLLIMLQHFIFELNLS